MWDLANYLTSCIMTLTFYKREENLIIIKILTALTDVIGLPTHFLFCSDTSPSLFQSSETPEALLPVSCLNNPSCLRGKMLPCPKRHFNIFWRNKLLLRPKGITVHWWDFLVRKRLRSNLPTALNQQPLTVLLGPWCSHSGHCSPITHCAQHPRQCQ